MYTIMKRLIIKYNTQYKNGEITAEEYANLKSVNQHKLDVFYLGNRLTEAQYNELSKMWLEIPDTTETSQTA